MEYYIGAFWLGIVPAAIVIAAAYVIGQIKPIRRAVIRWIER